MELIFSGECELYVESLESCGRFDMLSTWSEWLPGLRRDICLFPSGEHYPSASFHRRILLGCTRPRGHQSSVQDILKRGGAGVATWMDTGVLVSSCARRAAGSVYAIALSGGIVGLASGQVSRAEAVRDDGRTRKTSTGVPVPRTRSAALPWVVAASRADAVAWSS